MIRLPQGTLGDLTQSPVTWGLVLCALGLYVTFASSQRKWRRVGQLVSAIGLVVLAIGMPRFSPLSNLQEWTEQIVFWLLAAMTLGCSAATVTARNPVYTAIWFAASLVGVAGLFLFQNAQFLGVATIVVYAGAIVVTFLFVLMLANPEGDASYDRISWATFPVSLSIGALALAVGIGALLFSQSPPRPPPVAEPIPATDHVARFGGELFARHMISVEVAGTILLVALVGAVAIVIQGKDRRVRRVLPLDGSGEKLS